MFSPPSPPSSPQPPLLTPPLPCLPPPPSCHVPLCPCVEPFFCLLPLFSSSCLSKWLYILLCNSTSLQQTKLLQTINYSFNVKLDYFSPIQFRCILDFLFLISPPGLVVSRDTMIFLLEMNIHGSVPSSTPSSKSMVEKVTLPHWLGKYLFDDTFPADVSG